MQEYKPYPKIHRLGKDEVEGILNYDLIVQEKVDGANISIFQLDGKLRCGTRTRMLPEDESFRGFQEAVQSNLNLAMYFSRNPNHILYGEWLCLSGDTVIKKVSGGKSGKGNYMTLKEMYDYLHAKTDNRQKSWWERYGMPSIFSLYPSEDKVLPNKIKDIVYTGKKEVFEILTREGFKIKASAEHPFLTQSGYIKLKDLKPYHVVAISDLRSERTAIRNLGVGSRKILAEQRAYVREVGACVSCGNNSSLELDHIDEDWQNNLKNNWQVLCSSCHKSKSGVNKKTKAHSKGYSYRFDSVVSIKSVGVEDTYDISMTGNEDVANFVANGFIVHNCKHTITYPDEAYQKIYLFDIYDTINDNWLPQEDVRAEAEFLGLEYPHIFTTGKLTEEQIKEFVGKSAIAPAGEGVVLKAEEYTNQFGDHVYAKVVHQKFKEANAIVFGGNNKHSDTYWEMYIVNKYCTTGRVQKIMQKIQSQTEERLDMQHTSRVANTCYHDMITEEIWEIAKKVPAIDFKKLQHFSMRKFIQIYHDILNNSPSVADTEK